MSLQSVRNFFANRNLDIPIIELEVSTATVALAAEAHGVEAGRIAKTLAFRLKDNQVLLLVARGDEVVELTGHPVGGVCPFGLLQPLPIYLDQSLQDFDELIPAAGSTTSAVRISPALMAEVTEGVWVDVCVLPSSA